jgi:hypothetical protein
MGILEREGRMGLLETLIKNIFEARARELRVELSQMTAQGNTDGKHFVRGRLEELDYLAGQLFGSSFAEGL